MLQKRVQIHLSIIVCLLLLLKGYVANNMKLKSVLKDSSRSGNKTSNNNDENSFKEEYTKYLSQCGSNRSENNRESFGNDGNGDNYKHDNGNSNNKKDYYKNVADETENYQRGDRSSNSYDNTRNRGNSYNNRNGNNDRNNNNPYRNSGSQSDNNNDSRNCNGDSRSTNSNNDASNNYGGRGSNYGSNGYNNGYEPNKENKNCDSQEETSSSGYGSNRDYPYGQQNRYNNDNYYGSGMNGEATGYSYGQRSKRGSDYSREYDNQCTSQCVFGYMELLDDDRLPSETLFIKWVQDHITDDDMKRITSLREIRRCFGRLSTSDIEDGCEFSKELGKCMNLELD